MSAQSLSDKTLPRPVVERKSLTLDVLALGVMGGEARGTQVLSVQTDEGLTLRLRVTDRLLRAFARDLLGEGGAA